MAEIKREWVRNHRSSGFVAGRFAGEFKGQPREMLIIQTFISIETMNHDPHSAPA